MGPTGNQSFFIAVATSEVDQDTILKFLMEIPTNGDIWEVDVPAESITRTTHIFFVFSEHRQDLDALRTRIHQFLSDRPEIEDVFTVKVAPSETFPSG